MFHSFDSCHKTKLQLLGELHILNGSVKASKLFDRRTLKEVSAIEVMEHLIQNFQLVFNNRNGLLNTLKFLCLKVGVLLQGKVHILFNADVIDNQAFVLTLIYTVYTRDSLDKRVLLNRLVNVDGIQRRNVESGQPHINNNRNLKIGFDILKLTVKFLTVFLSTEHIEKLWFIVLVTCHNHTDFFNRLQFFLVFFGQFHAICTDLFFCPFGAKFNNNLV